MSVLRFVLRRLAHGALITLGVSVLTFTMLELAPGEFFDDLKMDATVAAGTVDSLRRANGLTQSPPVRYAQWLGSIARGDFGLSLAHRAPVAPLLWERVRNTLILTVPALFITWLIALPVGLWAARNRGRLLDRLCTGATSTLLAVPDLLIGLLMLLIALKSGLFPTGGMFSPGAIDGDIGARARDLAQHAFLPLCAIVVSTLPMILRHVRASAIDAAHAPAVRAARGHGIRGWRLDLRYILTIAANPLISLAGLSVAGLLSASLLIEVVMSWPGLGPLLVEALLARDVHVVLGASMLATLFLVGGNLLADLTLFAVDPEDPRMTRTRLLVGALVALHLLVALAGFVAPYDPASQDRSLPYAPPTALRVVDASGQLHAPFVYAQVPDPNDPAAYVDDTSRRFPVQLIANGHLFGVDAPARVSLLGTDGFGRDVFSRVLHGGRISVAAGLLATMCALLVGLTLGTLAGFFGGVVDRGLMRAADVFMALPWIYLLFAVRAALPLHIDTRATFLMLVAVLGIVGWARPARMIRGIVLSARERTYVRAAEGFGASSPYLLWRHILPHTYGIVLTQASVLVPQYLLAEVALSFLGLGIGEPTASWGGMLGTLQQYHVLTSYWWMLAPAVALATIALGYHALTALVQERARVIAASVLLLIALGVHPARAATPPAPVVAGEEILAVAGSGTHGGRLVVALRAEPRTLNPVAAVDAPSKDVIGRMTGNLIQINRLTQGTEGTLAKSWKRSADGLTYTLTLRRGLRFSDGHSFDADDVVFTFKVLLDPAVAAPHRDLLVVGGKPIAVTKVDAYTVRLTLAEPYAAAERLFDGIAILPRHLLESAYARGTLAEAWSLQSSPASIAGLGPYRLKHYVAGQELVLERNPYYWKADGAKRRLPYIDELVFLFAGNEDAQVIRFQSGESNILGRVSADNFMVLSKNQQAKHYQLKDLGPSLEYNFLVFNQNDLTGKNLPQVAAKQRWFGDVNFRRAVSLAVDRQGITRLVFKGRAVPLWGNVSPGNRLWINTDIPRPARSVVKARELLKASGFSWRADGSLVDKQGQRVEFTIVTSATSTQRTAMATLIQADLKELGMDVRVVPLEFRALVDRVWETLDYEASVQGFGGGDADPNAEMEIWLSRGSNHIWRLGQKAPATPWEAEIDRLMQQQLTTLDAGKRKALYDRVQTIVAEQLPFIFLAAPHILVAARGDLANFQPAVLDHYTLWNADQLYVTPRLGSQRR